MAQATLCNGNQCYEKFDFVSERSQESQIFPYYAKNMETFNLEPIDIDGFAKEYYLVVSYECLKI